MPTIDEARRNRAKKFDWLVGTNIRTFRIRKDITLETLAGRADMSRAQLSRIEKGERGISFRQATMIARALELPVERLCYPVIKAVRSKQQA